MRRAIVLGVLIVVGVTVALTAQPPQPQGPKVVEVEKVADNLFVLRGAGGGGNTAVFLTADGVTLVDTKNPGWGQPILDKVKELTPKPVTRIINTHTHGDHVSGSVEFPATVDVVVQDNTKANMEKMDIFKESKGVGLPKRTFKDKMSIGKGDDRIDLYYFGPGHTNGDAIIVFPKLRIAHTGDLFAGKSLPFVDGSNGGSVVQYPQTLMKVHKRIKNVDAIINGHTPKNTTWDDLKTFAEVNQAFLTWAQAALESGKPLKEAAAEWKMPEKYVAAGYPTEPPTSSGGIEGRLTLLQTEMAKK